MFEFRKYILLRSVGPPVFQRVRSCVVTVHTATSSVEWDSHCIFCFADFRTVVNNGRNYSTLFTEHNLKVPNRFLGDFSQLKETKEWKKNHIEGCRFKKSCLTYNGFFLRVQTSLSFVAVLKPMFVILPSKMCHTAIQNVPCCDTKCAMLRSKMCHAAIQNVLRKTLTSHVHRIQMKWERKWKKNTTLPNWMQYGNFTLNDIDEEFSDLNFFL